VTPDAAARARAQLIAALNAAHLARRGVPKSLEALVRSYARAERDAGIPVERVLVELKRLLAEIVHGEAELFAKRVVGWAVAGYYHSATE